MFLPKSRQPTAMGREGFFLEVSLTLFSALQLLMFLSKSRKLTAMGREGFFLEVSLTLFSALQLLMFLFKSRQLTAIGQRGVLPRGEFNHLLHGPTSDVPAQVPPVRCHGQRGVLP